MDWTGHAQALAGRVTHKGSRWYRPICETPRHHLVPAWWIRDGDGWQVRRGPSANAYADTSLITRVGPLHADHAGDDDRPFGEPTSSSTLPSLCVSMYRHGRLDEDARILDVGTGSGYGAALLCHRYGSGNVTTIDIDPYLTAVAEKRLDALGHNPRVLTGDATAALPGRFDRIVATVSVRPIPPAWLEALPVGGRIATTIAGTWIILTAQRTRDGVFGQIARDWSGFMQARHSEDYEHGGALDWATLKTAEGEHVARGRYPVLDIGNAWELHTMIELECPGLSHRYEQSPDGHRTAIVTHPDGSWARAEADGLDAPTVHQSGPGRLWDEIDRVRDIWLEQGQAPFLGANVMVLEDGTVKVARGTYRATIA
jgi:protein-L-isoaspartate O-methyltransferase